MNRNEMTKIACPIVKSGDDLYTAAIIFRTQMFPVYTLTSTQKKIQLYARDKRKLVVLQAAIRMLNSIQKNVVQNDCKRKLGNEKDLFTRSNSNVISGITIKKNFAVCVVGIFNFLLVIVRTQFWKKKVSQFIVIKVSTRHRTHSARVEGTSTNDAQR